MHYYVGRLLTGRPLFWLFVQLTRRVRSPTCLLIVVWARYARAQSVFAMVSSNSPVTVL
jgi:hypothetical protein